MLRYNTRAPSCAASGLKSQAQLEECCLLRRTPHSQLQSQTYIRNGTKLLVREHFFRCPKLQYISLAMHTSMSEVHGKNGEATAPILRK